MYADYDSDEVGSAGGSDEEGEGAAARGRDIEEFDAVLDEYLANKPILVYDPEDKPDAGVKATGVVRAVIADAVEEEMTEEEMTAWRLRQEQKDEWIAEQHALQRRTRDDDDEAKWDCETYLSTYSNLYNHPRVIAEPRAPRTQTTAIAEALDADADADGDADGHDDDDGESVCAANKGAARSKGETADERRARKQAVKAERRERRSEKKQTREAFKAEKIRQDKMEASARTQAVRL
jgi:protein LTV1